MSIKSNPEVTDRSSVPSKSHEDDLFNDLLVRFQNLKLSDNCESQEYTTRFPATRKRQALPGELVLAGDELLKNLSGRVEKKTKGKLTSRTNENKEKERKAVKPERRKLEMIQVLQKADNLNVLKERRKRGDKENISDTNNNLEEIKSELTVSNCKMVLMENVQHIKESQHDSQKLVDKRNDMCLYKVNKVAAMTENISSNEGIFTAKPSSEKYDVATVSRKRKSVKKNKKKRKSQSAKISPMSNGIFKHKTDTKAREKLERIIKIHENISRQYAEIHVLLKSEKSLSNKIVHYEDMLQSVMRNMKCVMNSQVSEPTEVLDSRIDKSKYISDDILSESNPVRAKRIDFNYMAADYAHYRELNDYLTSYESKYKSLVENISLKSFRFDCQKAVNIPINSISSVSRTHLRDKFEKLFLLLRGRIVQVANTCIKATRYKKGIHYCTALLARKIVKQGALVVSSDPNAAFPVAAVSVALITQFPELARLLVGNLNKMCPYTVPMFPQRHKGQTEKEYNISRGYSYEGEEMEGRDMFLKRMSGVFRLQCAVWVTKAPTYLNVENPVSLQCAWQWLHSFIRLRQESDLCATLLYDFLEICSFELYQLHRNNFIEILRYIGDVYVSTLTDSGPKSRLEELLLNILEFGNCPSPNVVLPYAW